MCRKNIVFGLVASAMLAAGMTLFAAGILLVGCTATAVVDKSSPRCLSASIEAGSKLTESSQYVEIRLTFDKNLKANGNVADDLVVQVNGETPDARTMGTEVLVASCDVVVRLVPTQAADGSQTSVYYALFDGLVILTAKDASGGLLHVYDAGGSSNAVVSEPCSFTVPSGVELAPVQTVLGEVSSHTPASVTFDVVQFAKLRCCTWVSFADDLSVMMMHNHEFLRDTEQTCAARLANTVNACFDDLEAQAQGARVSVRAKAVVDGQKLACRVVAGKGVNPRAGAKENPVSDAMGGGV